MTAPTRTLSRTVTIVNALGLHARSAARVATIAGKASGSVWIESGKERVDASSIIDMLSLGCAQGTRVQVVIEATDDSGVLEDIVSLIQSGFGEPS
ncbi:MAG: HPr family phosphocarrier protein [Pseudomonadota bacterium]